MEFDNELLLRTFVSEGEEILSEMEEALLTLEQRPKDGETIRDILRGAHTLKGNAACLGLEALAAVMHRIEDFLQRLHEGEAEVDQITVTQLLTFVDAIRESVAAAASGRDVVPEVAIDIAEQLTGASGIAAPAVPAVATPQSAAAVRAGSIRVETAKLDRALDLTGEISIARGRLRQTIDLGRPLDEISESCDEVERLSGELQELVMKLRMVPVGPFFRQYSRTVRDVAASHQKSARLVLEGEDVEVDLGVIERLRNPLTHLIRNAVDHGIERPQLRRERGKPAEGKITLGAHRHAGTIVIRIADDGAGLDRSRIATRARGMALAAEPEKLSDHELFRLIFTPGFSTAEQVTDISGRGFGMDIVRRNVEEMHGSVSVESHDGTAVTLRLPLTVAIIDGFVVGCGDEYYVLPLDAISECVAHVPRNAEDDGVYDLADVRGEAVPYVRLRRYFGLGGRRSRSENLVVVTAEGRRAGIVVDVLYGERQVVIKPLGRIFQRIPVLAGSAVLGNGRVAMVLDVAELLERCMADLREEGPCTTIRTTMSAAEEL
jgi:two-component system chemotaxis sensor kinase CheA